MAIAQFALFDENPQKDPKCEAELVNGVAHLGEVAAELIDWVTRFERGISRPTERDVCYYAGRLTAVNMLLDNLVLQLKELER
jgi:hypothetical protein